MLDRCGRNEEGGAWRKLENELELVECEVAATRIVKMSKGSEGTETKRQVVVVMVGYGNTDRAAVEAGGWENAVDKVMLELRVIPE